MPINRASRQAVVRTRPPSVTVTLALVFLGAIIWLVFGVLLALNAHPAFPDEPFVRIWMAVLSLAAAVALLVLLVFLTHRQRSAYYAALGALALASLAIFLDDVGLVDLVIFAVFLMPLILLVRDRAWYTGG